jgi:hypothetical protein
VSLGIYPLIFALAAVLNRCGLQRVTKIIAQVGISLSAVLLVAAFLLDPSDPAWSNTY